MRNGNNKRMRGRNNRGGGKGPNPLSRSYESNGPDVKIRGTAQHIAEKYLQLARDAHSSGDPVAAESYLQHAEHYFRLIAAAQEAQRLQQPRPDGQPVEDEADEDDDDDFASPFDKRFESPVVVRPEPPPQQQQPRSDFGGGQRDYQGQGGRDYQGDRRDFQGGERRDFQGQNRDRDRFPDRQDRPRFQDRQDRQDRPRFHQEAAGGEQPDVQGAAPDGEGQRQDGRPFESRRERFERRRAERFAERQSRREGQGFDQDEGGEPGDAPRASSDRPAAERPPVERSSGGREEETESLGLPSFITGGAVSAPVQAEDEAPPAPRPRKRRTPRVEDDAPAEAAEKTPAAE
jgi:hypothetical protein